MSTAKPGSKTGVFAFGFQADEVGDQIVEFGVLDDVPRQAGM